MYCNTAGEGEILACQKRAGGVQLSRRPIETYRTRP